MVIGVDFGNVNTKTSTGIIFPSRISKDTNLINHRQSDKNLLKYNNTCYLVGEGEYQTETNKLDKEMFKVCVLTALAKSNNSQRFKIVIGIPGNQFNNENKERLKAILLKDRFYNIEFEGAKRTVVIEDLEVFPESAGAYYGMTNEQRQEIGHHDLIIVNIGGGNTNIGYFRFENSSRKLIKSSTVMTGTLHLFADVINSINGKYSVCKSIEDCEGILKQGLYIYSKQADISFIRPYIQAYVDKIFKELNLYDIKTSKVMFTGGGSRLFGNMLSDRIPGAIFQTNYMFANAEGFKKVGDFVWQNG